MNIFKKVSMGVLCLVFAFNLSLQNTSAAGPSAVNLGDAGNFVILAKTGISTTGSTYVVGDIGVSPAAATYITGFALDLPAESAFATSSIVSGKVYAPGYANPTPANMSTAISNMETAYTDAAGRTNPTATELGAGNIGGMTLAPGLYKWSTGLTIPSDVTLSGSANDVWIFQIAQNLNISSGQKVILSGGAKANNVFWVVAGQTTIGTTAIFNGNILGQTAIVLNTGAQLNGRALAQTAVTLDANAVIIPSSGSTSSTSTSTSNTTSNSSSSSSSNSNNSSSTTSKNTNTSVVCSPGQIFKAATGERCNSFVDKVFCPKGQLFNGTNGERCNTIISTSNAKGASAYNFGTNLIKQGNTGESCKVWQRFFNEKRNAGLVVDGKCGPLTMSAARSWQTSAGLNADGLLGTQSRDKAEKE